MDTTKTGEADGPPSPPWGHRRIFPKSRSKRHRGTLSEDFFGAALWAKRNRH